LVSQIDIIFPSIKVMQRDSDTKYNSSQRDSIVPGGGSLTIPQACDLLQQAKVRNCNLLSNASNYVFLATMIMQENKVKAIYKPRQGEIPLWDFPDGTLYKREYAAFVVSEALQWQLIPPTVIRDGPYGIGSMQWFVETKSGTRQDWQIEDSTLKQVALFDYLVNNADRKAGHFLEGRDGRLWLVDHGLTFNVEPKLRTVLWDFSGESVPDKLLADVKVLQDRLMPKKPLRDALRPLIEESEIEAFELRINNILEKPAFVRPGPNRSIPWPWF
jgi:hypothetical protein